MLRLEARGMAMILLPLLFLPFEALNGSGGRDDNECDEFLRPARGMMVGVALSCHFWILLVGLSFL